MLAREEKEGRMVDTAAADQGELVVGKAEEKEGEMEAKIVKKVLPKVVVVVAVTRRTFSQTMRCSSPSA